MRRPTRLLAPAFALALFAILLVPATASAGDPSRQGTLVISADNLFGMVFGEWELETPGPDFEWDFSMVGFGASEPTTPLWTPRLAFDGFVIDGLSLGGSLSLVFRDDEDDFDDDNDDLLFLLNFRVGYLYMFADWVGIWGRGGFSYYNDDEEPNDNADRTQFALDLEGIFLFKIGEDWGILAGPTAKIGLAGEWGDDPDDDDDYHEWGVGISVGLAGWIGL